MNIVCIRGAITVSENKKDDILKQTRLLLKEIIAKNNINIEDIVSINFTATKDLDKAYPAVAARELGITDAALMCMQELYVMDSLPMCVRIGLTAYCGFKQKDAKHIYMEGAKVLRPDIR